MSSTVGLYGRDVEMTLIDAHQHFWRIGEAEQSWRTPQHGAIEHDYLPDELAIATKQVGVTGTVLMQSVDESAENDRLAEFAADELVAGVVAWLPIAEPDQARREWDRQQISKLSGVRCLIGRDPLDWLGAADTRRLMADVAAAGLAWDVVPLTNQQTDAIVALALAVPELRIVIDHLGRPPLDGGDWSEWDQRLGALAACEQIAIKLSVGLDVLTGWESWDSEQLRRPIQRAAELFGAERCMIASNWPVVELKADYARAWTDIAAHLGTIFSSEGEREQVLAETAIRCYGLDRHAASEGM